MIAHDKCYMKYLMYFFISIYDNYLYKYIFPIIIFNINFLQLLVNIFKFFTMQTYQSICNWYIICQFVCGCLAIKIGVVFVTCLRPLTRWPLARSYILRNPCNCYIKSLIISHKSNAWQLSTWNMKVIEKSCIIICFSNHRFFFFLAD